MSLNEMSSPGGSKAPQSGKGKVSKSSTHTSAEHDKFLVDCDHLVMFCTHFEQCNITDHAVTVLEVKLEDLEHRWSNVISIILYCQGL